MTDRETTLRDLENLGAWHTHHYTQFHYEASETIHNALALLKEREPVKPKTCAEREEFCTTVWHECGACKKVLASGASYCQNCGVKVAWWEADDWESVVEEAEE